MRITITALFALVLAACSHDDDPPPPPPAPPHELLLSINWDSGLTSQFHYNADSTLKRIDFLYGTISGSYHFKWSGRRLVEYHDDRSLYKNMVHYTNGRVANITNTIKQGTSASSWDLAFSYHTNGNVKQLVYSVTNEAGKQVKATTEYFYDNGELSEVLIDQGPQLILFRIDGYTDEVNFNPCAFIDASLNENYVLNNYVVMSQLKRLPSKITRLVTPQSGATFTDKVQQDSYTVHNKRIDKLKMEIIYPNMTIPGVSAEGIFHY